MRKQFFLLFLLFLPLLAMAQSTIVVPKNIYFADIHLRISNGAQQEIQKKVDALHRFPVYFNVKVDLANAYFPLIERTFREEGVPDDFKYLALQESGLIGDAVSTSNAVGYWQFKREAALDFSLRMDNVIDERKHIIEASRGAAKYFKRSNNYYNNWFNTVLSYYHGYTGAKAATRTSDIGSKKMDVTERTDPYLLTFLAHKVAYENFVGKSAAISLREMRATPGQSLSDIALATQTDYAELEKYNKWLLGNSIPSDKDYYVMVPVRGDGQSGGLLASAGSSGPYLSRQNATQPAAGIIKKNGLNALVAREGDTRDMLALQAGISTKRFLNYNDLRSFDNIEKGQAYYIEAKKNSAEQEFHVVQPGETMQLISQHYGIKLTYLLHKNRMARTEVPVPGRVLWLQKRRPFNTPVEVRDQQQPAPQQNTPVLAKDTRQTTPKTASTKETRAEDAPKENIFTRFINSLKREPKEEPEIFEEETEVFVKTKVPQAEPVSEPVPAAEPRQQPSTPSVKEQQQPASGSVLYPGTKTTTPAATSPADTTKEGTENVFGSPSKQEATEAEEPTGDLDIFKPRQGVEEVEEAVVAEEEVKTPVPAQPAKALTPASKPTRHLVKQGETLYGISRMYAVSVNDISEWNRLGEEPIKVGQELLIAEPQTLPEEQRSPSNAATATAHNGYHTVAAGETLYQITKKYAISLEDLLGWNNMKTSSIKVGQQLRIAAPAGGSSSTAKPDEATATRTGSSQGNHHIVQAGESMYQISRKYGITIKDIMEWNNKSDFNVAAGEKLLIKK